ncbi:MAG: aspartate/glutamate racemase family protein [Nitratireductor sp.]|nr:aspartate/glutamate racemase family protein [Nitratireductor sp.]
MDYVLDRPATARLGLIVLQVDETIEGDFRRLLPAEVELFVSRVPSGLEVTRETLGEMEGHLPQAASLLPQSATFDSIGYGCTSGTSVIGTARVGELVHQGVATRSVTEPVSALIAACQHLGVARIGFLSPYVAEVSLGLRNVLAESGIDTPAFASFNVAEEAKVARISPASTANGAARLCEEAGVDAVFLSCTNLRTLDILAGLERRVGRPVLSSNQVLAWHMMRLAGIDSGIPGFGRLFEH